MSSKRSASVIVNYRDTPLMKVYFYIVTGYERNQKEAFLSESYYNDFLERAEEQMEDENLLHMDGKIQEGKEKLVKSVYKQLGKIKSLYSKKMDDLYINPLYLMDGDGINEYMTVISNARELGYCNIWEVNPVISERKIKLDNGEIFIILELDAEAG
jgi:hypothetical protein